MFFHKGYYFWIHDSNTADKLAKADFVQLIQGKCNNHKCWIFPITAVLDITTLFSHLDVSKDCVELIEKKADDAKVSNVQRLTKARAPYASDFKASGVQCCLDINLQWLGREAIAIQRGALEVSKLRKLV